MARKPTSHGRALPDTTAYRGYLIRRSTINGEMWIEKDRHIISSVKSIDDAKAIIDSLTNENPPRRRRRSPGKQARRTVRSFRKNPSRRPRGLDGGQGRTVSSLKVVKYGGTVDQMKYEDANDGKGYVHDFGDAQASMLLCEHHSLGRCLLIVSNDSKPLWEDA